VEFEQEQSFVPDYSGNAAEWHEIISASSAPTCSNSDSSPDLADVQFCNSDNQAASIPGWLNPCESERHIGIDQGMVAVDRRPDTVPTVSCGRI